MQNLRLSHDMYEDRLTALDIVTYTFLNSAVLNEESRVVVERDMRKGARISRQALFWVPPRWEASLVQGEMQNTLE